MITKFILTITTILVCLNASDIQSKSSLSKKEDPTAFFNEEDWRQVTCLQDNIFYEARSENYWGRLAVGAVILNRSEKRNLDICNIVYEPYQFSWILQTSEEQRQLIKNIDRKAYNEILHMSIELYINPDYKYDAGIGNRGYYLNPEMTKRRTGTYPKWYRECEDKTRVGNHVFCEVI